MLKKRTEPRKVCVIETEDGFYKVIRISKYIPLIEEFLLTRFSLGHIAINKFEMQQDILELQIKESDLYNIMPEAIEVVHCKVSKKLNELCEIDKDGMITVYKPLSNDEWEEAPKMKRNKNASALFYDLTELEKIRQHAFADIVDDDTLTIDFYALGKRRALSNLKPMTSILNSIEQAESIINEELDANDFEFYGDDIDFQSGLIAGYTSLLEILKNAPIFEKEIEIRYIVLINPESAWDKLLTKKKEWVKLSFIGAESISAFAIATDDANEAEILFSKCDSNHTKLIALYQRGETIPKYTEKHNEIATPWKIGKATKNTVTEHEFWNIVKSDIKAGYSLNKIYSNKG